MFVLRLELWIMRLSIAFGVSCKGAVLLATPACPTIEKAFMLILWLDR